MARPTVETLNRNPGVPGGRQTQSPGVAVQAPLSVNVGTNSLQALAEILGTGAQVAISQAAKDSQDRVKEEENLISAKAEADFYGDTVDEEAYRKQRTYRARYDTIKGAREGTEMALGLAEAADKFVKDNPLADEQELRTFLKDWRNREILDDNGQPKEFMANPRTAAIVESAINETGYKIIAGHRAGYQQRLKEKTGDEAEGLYLADARSKGGTSLGNMEGFRTQLRAAGYTEEEANKKITNATLALARATLNPQVLDLLPEVWQDGTLGPKSDAETLATVSTQKEIVSNQAEAARLEKLKPLQLEFLTKIDDKIRKGETPTKEELDQGINLGFSPTTVASWQDNAIRTATALAEKAAREAKEANKHNDTLAEIRANPWAQSKDKIEDTLGVEFDNALKTGNPATANTIIREAIKYNALPTSLRNRLNRIPTNPQEFAQWRQTMAMIDNEDDQVFLSLGQDARTAYAAYNGLAAIGRFTPEQIFQRLQARDPDRGQKFVQSQRGQKAVASIVGAAAGSLEYQKAEEFVRTFASLEDFTDEEATSIAKAAFEKTYLVHEGRVFHRAYAPNKAFINWLGIRYAEDLTKAGTPTEGDDIIVAPIEGTSRFILRVRGEPSKFQILESQDAKNELRKTLDRQDRERRAPAQAAQSSAKSGLNPWRYENGENGLQRQQRAGRENAERRRLGLPTFPTPTSWDNANRSK